MKNNRLATALIILVLLAAPALALLPADQSAADGAVLTDYREQLDVNGQAMYDAMEGLSTDDLKGSLFTVTVTLPQPLIIAVGEKDGEQLLHDELYSTACQAWQATKLDDPYAFWTWSYDSATVAVSLVTTPVAGSTYLTASSCTILISVSTAYDGSTGTTLTAMVAAVKDTVSGITTISGSGWALVQSINSYLCDSSIAYDSDNKASTYHSSVYGVFAYEVDGKHYAVCEGYACAFKLLCDQYGADAKVVFGNANLSSLTDGSVLHAWNLAVIDGTVYGVDTTWNSTNSNKSAYLGVGTATAVDGITFAQSHSPWSPYYTNADDVYAFQLPAVSATAYGSSNGGSGTNLGTYLPWIVIVVIAVILCGVLYSVGRKGQR